MTTKNGLREITKSEYHTLLDEETRKARRRRDETEWTPELEGGDTRYWFTSELDPPCIYFNGLSDPFSTVKCIHTGEEILKTWLPPGFQNILLENDIVELHHASDEPCQELWMGKTVRCYCYTPDGYFTGEHEVGSCPWKEADVPSIERTQIDEK